MKRRDFLKGAGSSMVAMAAATPLIAGAVKTVSIPPAVNGKQQAWVRQWLLDVAPVWRDYADNVFIFGSGALRSIDEYPFVESVHPSKVFPAAPTDGHYGRSPGLACLEDVTQLQDAMQAFLPGGRLS